MKLTLCLVLLGLIAIVVNCQKLLPTNYEYYTTGGIKSGLRADSEQFTLNGKQITLFSGSLHYFRLPREYWTDRLTKYRAAGLNTVETYSPWNLHEETPGNWDFETGYLNLVEFLKAAKAADMFVVYRPGPYICAEWEMGGYPAWLIRDPNMKLRSNYKPYLEAVGKYYQKVLSLINDYQFTKGGPIIALQFENEFGGINSDNDRQYFQFLKDTVDASGFKELLINCDSGSNAVNAMRNILPGVLETDNFNSNSLKYLADLRKAQPNKPLFVTEWWPGRCDYWGDKHYTMDVKYFEKEIYDVMFNGNSSINFYMFFGGTNFGFLNGARVVTSYDYDAPLSETGNYTAKYWKTKELIEKFNKDRAQPELLIPKPPTYVHPTAYGEVKVVDYLSLDDLFSKIKPIITEKPYQMELLNLTKNSGQHFGFINYRLDNLQKFKNLKIKSGVSDRAVVLIDHKEVAIIDSNKDYNLDVSDTQFSNTTTHTLDILVENMGRANGGQEMNTARKGINGDISLDGKVVTNYNTFPLEFKPQFVKDLSQIKGKPFVSDVKSPAVYRLVVNIKDSPLDTFIQLNDWVKGNVFINGFNLGRYWPSVGPQRTLYIPAPLLKTGENDIKIFELHSPKPSIHLIDLPDLG